MKTAIFQKVENEQQIKSKKSKNQKKSSII
jgi:hypothetical protein